MIETVLLTVVISLIVVFLLWSDRSENGGAYFWQRSWLFANGAQALWRMVRTVGQFRDAAIFLVARSFYVDGMTAVLTFFGHRGVLKATLACCLLLILPLHSGRQILARLNRTRPLCITGD